jgi:hypothetical protein
MNSSAWDKFRKQQATEREQLQRLLSGIHGLLGRCRTTAPSEIELSALAALLHSFYTGVENIFKRVVVELDGDPVRGDAWHRELLLRMKTPTAHRPALLSEELHDSLNEYLRFRHVFRNANSFLFSVADGRFGMRSQRCYAHAFASTAAQGDGLR